MEELFLFTGDVLSKLNITVYDLYFLINSGKIPCYDDYTGRDMHHKITKKMLFEHMNDTVENKRVRFATGQNEVGLRWEGKDIYFYAQDIKSIEVYIDELKYLDSQVGQSNKFTVESEKEEIKKLMSEHDISKGKAKEMRIAHLKDVYQLDWLEISELQGFEHEDENHASANLRGRATKGRKLINKYK